MVLANHPNMHVGNPNSDVGIQKPWAGGLFPWLFEGRAYSFELKSWSAVSPSKYIEARGTRVLSLYKHEESSKVIDEIGTFGFESGQYQEHRGLNGIIQRRIQGFEPKAFSLLELHDEELVPLFKGI
ncbi:unnamed protein product [Cuscuta campestris]|uniref:Uncharacterized protein n=1 Tax=Cuscuta campestris TaxID=132261 RepID=A0A484K5V8_9ASTE|nr:unnamed protein product [Cuscuta campestris]